MKPSLPSWLACYRGCLAGFFSRSGAENDTRWPNIAAGKEWHRSAVGGLWDEIGKLQFQLMLSHGLKPEHYLLDIGCGSLRGGVHFIGYLDGGHYVGVDRDGRLLDAGREIELPRYGIAERQPVLVRMDDFDFASLGQPFDFAIAQSVFTHLPAEDVQRCLTNLNGVMKSGGLFLATYFEAPHGRKAQPVEQPRVGGPAFISYPDRDPYHYEFREMEAFCGRTGWSVEQVGDFGHPRSQKLLVFRVRTAS